MIELSHGHARLLIDEKNGGRAAQWHISDYQVLKPMIDQPIIGGWYAMAPWAGRITDNQIKYASKKYPQEKNLDEWAIHGTVFYTAGEVVDQTKNSLKILHQTTDKWIAAGEIWQEWKIEEDLLFTAIEIRTKSEPFPASCGWHPWFLRKLANGEPAQYQIAAEKKYQRGPDYLPTGNLIEVGEGPFDDAFVVPTGTASITWPKALKIDISTNCDTFVLYDLPDDSFCIEPSSGYPDQINREPLIVTKDSPLRIESSWRVSLL
jgi:aldose 1-epimerase